MEPLSQFSRWAEGYVSKPISFFLTAVTGIFANEQVGRFLAPHRGMAGHDR